MYSGYVDPEERDENDAEDRVVLRRGEYEYTINFNGDDEFYVDVTKDSRPNEYASTVIIETQDMTWYKKGE